MIGDHDHGIHVDPGMVAAYRQHLLSQAHGLMPNGFELERLSGQSVEDIDGVIAAARCLLTGATHWVAVTSAAPATWTADAMQVAVVTRDEARILQHPRIDASPKGTGDLFAATLTAGLPGETHIFEVAALACERVVEALRRTRDSHCGELLLTT